MATRVGGIVFHKLGGFTVLARLSIDCNFNSDSLLVSQAFTSNCKRSSIIAIPAFPIPWAMLCAINQLLASYQSRFLLSCLACLLVSFFCLFDTAVTIIVNKYSCLLRVEPIWSFFSSFRVCSISLSRFL